MPRPDATPLFREALLAALRTERPDLTDKELATLTDKLMAVAAYEGNRLRNQRLGSTNRQGRAGGHPHPEIEAEFGYDPFRSA